ncbi:type II toxin-antitoxin system VapC family toxin [Cellulomonas sp. B6]|uniref:type II toxin-antitoxin system VapC family toxin n=1 Tax=Cellulomonas sp. B6 TaxID=1295626 RepID=UPI00073CD782|nr:type II toxin-antitoxin system VapC family toxin [Cellulomonas sp. B6]KSW30317.1 twitching motility protein PilT [Cellulomonas sp. B6]
MALAYLDTSALVKLCVAEPGTDLVAAVWDGADLVVTSRLADAEVRAVLASGRRAGALDDDAARTATAAWRRLSPGLRLVETVPAVLDEAARLVERHPLRAADAVHLASALVLRSPDLLVLAWDEHLAVAARSEGLAVLPRP